MSGASCESFASSEPLTQTALAKELGVSRQRVGHFVKRGLPFAPGTRRTDLETARAWVAANVDHSRRNGWKGVDTPVASDADTMTLSALKHRREELRVEREEVELEKARGEMVERDRVERFLTGRAKLERDSWVAWASRLATTLAAETGCKTEVIFPAVEKEVREHLRELADTPLGVPQ